jgi:hypothetical protein
MRGLPDRARRSSESYSIIAVERPAPGIVFERAIESVGHRAHLTPQFGFENVSAASSASTAMIMKPRWVVSCRTRSRFRSSMEAILVSDGVSFIPC